MKQPLSNAAGEFHFELSANGEQTTFQEVEGLSTEVILRNNIKPGDNPFKFRIPSMPKTRNLVLKNGQCQQNSKLMEWSAEGQNPAVPTTKNNVNLRLKDANGKSLLEWTLHRAHPIKNTSADNEGQTNIDNLELGFSFYTLSKK